jgi:hypothetical protein
MTPAEVGLTAQQAGRATAALARLQSQGQSGGRYPQVTRVPAQEDASFITFVHIHDGPSGHGRTVYIEMIRNNLLVRRSVGEGSHGLTSDGWIQIDLTKLLKT